MAAMATAPAAASSGRDVKEGTLEKEEYQVCKERASIFRPQKRYTLEYFKSSKGGKPGFTWDLRSKGIFCCGGSWRAQLHEAKQW